MLRKLSIFTLCRLSQQQMPFVCKLCPYSAHDMVFRYHDRKYASRTSPTKFYDVLGLTPSATHSQIKDAFYRLSKIYHPDVNKNDSAHAMFQELSQAYEVLGNKRSRRLYDRGLLNPTDPRARHEAGSNVEEATEETFKPKAESAFRRKDHIPTGKSRIYNFDEFYQQHYGEALKRAAETRESSSADDVRKLSESTKRVHRWYLVCLFIFSFFVLIYPSFENKNRDERKTSS